MYFVQEVERRCREARDSDQTNDKCYVPRTVRFEIVAKKCIRINSTFANGFNAEKNIYFQLEKWHKHILVDIKGSKLIKKWITYCHPQCNPSMYHYNINNVNFTSVPIIHLIDSQLYPQ